MAASLLEQAGWTLPAGEGIRRDGDGNRLRLTLAAAPQLEPAMTVVQAQLRRVGVDLQLQFMEFASFISAIMNPDTRPDAMALGFYPRIVRPDLYSLLSSHGEQNLSGYADPGMDATLDSLQTTTDPTRLRELYSEVQRRVAQDVPMVYTIYVPNLLAVGPRVQDVSAGLNGPFASVAAWWIPPARRHATD
jgi:ABC-type transport system substrate-binding protein